MEQRTAIPPAVDVEPLESAEESAESMALESPETDGAQALTKFNNLMALYGDVIVESPRLPGVPLPLQALMNACPEPPTEENAHKFLAEANSLLAVARAKENEETPEEDDTEEEAEPQEAKKKLI